MIYRQFSYIILLLWSIINLSQPIKKLDVRVVDRCPTDLSSWEKASRDLNCTPADRYQCTSNQHQTTLVEFCYDQPTTFVSGGHCWILLDSNYVDVYNCSGFTDGCPNTAYRSNELYKYQNCLQLDTLKGCFRTDETCVKQREVMTTTDGSAHKIIIPLVTFGSFLIVLVAALFILKKRAWNCYTRNIEEGEIPLLDFHPAQLNLEGRNLQLSCTCDKNSPRKRGYKNRPHKTTWLKDGSEITVNESEGKFRVTEDQLSLVIANADYLDVGKYSCNITCGNRRMPTDIVFILECPILIIHKLMPREGDIDIAYSVTVSEACKAITTLNWTKNNSELDLSDAGKKYRGGKLSDCYLTISNVTIDDHGCYECKIQNIFGENTVSFTLECPSLTVQQIIPKGTYIEIQYSVTVSEECRDFTTLIWTKDDSALDLSDAGLKYDGGTLTDSCLRISNVAVEDHGCYECKIQNILGENTVPFTLDPVVKETVKIESGDSAKMTLTETLTDVSISILNDVTDIIHKATSDTEIDELYELIEEMIDENKDERSILLSSQLFIKVEQKIRSYADLRENKIQILVRFTRFIIKLKKKYGARLECSRGSLLLKLTFSSERGYTLYMKDSETGEIGRLILDVLLYPPYLANFDLHADDLMIHHNDNELTAERNSPFSKSPATQISSITIPGVEDVASISVLTSDRLWVSDSDGCLMQVDSTGHVLLDDQRNTFKNWYAGSHTVTGDGDLLFIYNYYNVRKLTSDGTVTTLLTTDLAACCIHSSRINGDILVGSFDDKVTRYNRTGRELQVIEKDDKGHSLYDFPYYITENENGDVWISEHIKQAVVVVDKSGRHRFNYTGRQFDFFPHGICTDTLGHALVCDEYNDSVHLLDQDGQFLSLLLTREQHGINSPVALCVDEHHHLYLGQSDSNTIKVYAYLQDTDVK